MSVRVNGMSLYPAIVESPANSHSPGQNWKSTRTAFHPSTQLTSTAPRKGVSKGFLARMSTTAAMTATKAKLTEMKDEKEAERQRRIKAIKDKRVAREEKERYEKMAQKMHVKRVERRKRREKRNKLLNS